MRLIKRFYRRYQSFVLSGMLLTISLLVLFVGIIPVGKKINDLWTQIKDLRENVRILSQKANELDNLNEQTLSKQFFDLVSAVPTNKSIQTIFITTESLLSQTGVSVSNISIQSPGSIASGSATAQTSSEKSIGGSKLTYSLSGKGTFDQVQSMLRTIHKVRRLVNVTKLDLGIDKAASVSMQLSVDTYYKPLSNTTPSIDSPIPQLTEEEKATLATLSDFPWLSQPVANVSANINPEGKADPFAP